MAKPTPRPWERWGSTDDPHTPGSFAIAKHIDGQRYSLLGNFWAHAGADIPDSELEANAHHIVKCVNAHEKLVAFVRGLVSDTRDIDLSDYDRKRSRVSVSWTDNARLVLEARKLLKEIEGE